jgi:hypothetical protein
MSDLSASANCAHEVTGVSGNPLRSAVKGAAPQSSRLEHISAAIKNLAINEWLIIDSEGGVHQHKTPFKNGEALPVATISLKSPGVYEVFSGLAPTNDTFCISNNSSRQIEKQPLIYSMVLRSGDCIKLADTFVNIPDFLPSGKVENPIDLLEQRIAQANVGEVVILGRKYKELSPHVSRIHASVRIIKKEVLSDNRLSMVVEVMSGMPSKTPIIVQGKSNDQSEIYGKRLVPAGSTLLIESLGSITLPHPANSPADFADSVRGISIDEAHHQLNTYLKPSLNLDYTNQVRAKERISGVSEEKLVLGNALEHLICKSLTFIKEKNYTEAIATLTDSPILKLMGYTYLENHSFSLGEISEAAVMKNLHEVAHDSWFIIGEKRIYPSFGFLQKGVTPKNDYEQDLVGRWQKEVALIYAEEFTHALQDWLETNVARKAALYSPKDHEADIAAFFYEQGVSLSHEFVKNRYSQRDTCLAIIRGYQTTEDQKRFESALAQTPIGQKLFIAPDSDKQASAKNTFFPSPSEEVGLEERILTLRKQGLTKTDSLAVSITRNPDGSYTLAPESEDTKAFSPDASGYYSRLTAPVVLEPGTPFYVGSSFKFILRQTS